MIGFATIILQFGGVLLYGYTLYLAYSLSGFFAALASAAFPGIANFYWIYDRWSVTGEFFNFYTNMNILWVFVYIVAALILGGGLMLKDKSSKNDL
jgi:hypothetical protein